MTRLGRSNLFQATPSRITFIILGLIGFILGINLAFIIFIHDEPGRQIFSDVVSPISNGLSTVALIIAAWQSRSISKRVALAWGILALAQFTYFIGDVLWSSYELFLKEAPFPSIADIAYLVYYPLFLVGVFHLPFKKSSSLDWVKTLVEISAVMVGAILFFGNFVIGPLVISKYQETFLIKFLTMAYPVGDLVMLWALLLLLYRRIDHQNGIPVIFLSVGVLSMIITDCIYSVETISGTYNTGGFLDLGWQFYYLFIGLAGYWQVYTIHKTQEDQPSGSTLLIRLNKLRTILNYMPYFWLAAALILMVWAHMSPLPMGFVAISIGVALISGLLMINQMMTLIENDRLNHQLQQAIETVQHQTNELRKINWNLEAEIVERRNIEKQLAHDALHDGLTGLPNRVLLMDRLRQAVEYTKRKKEYSFSVIYLDLDQFKIVNDSLGHNMGDELLKKLSQRLVMHLRSCDTIARLGGDEFVILIENNSNESGVIVTAERIQKEISQPIHLGVHDIFITSSMGIVQSLDHYKQAEDVLRDADIAMYRAKEMGKARYEIFSAGLRTHALSRVKLETELRHAIDHHEFVLHYQPIYSLQTNQLVAFEALIRWNHPLRGLLYPADFIQIAEETGLILPLGKWVLSEACYQLNQWHDQFPGQNKISIQVNISGKQLSQADFVEQVVLILNETGVHPSLVKLEITESTIIENQEKASEYLNELSKIGVQLHIDDFGTGYSSLSYVQYYPINAIKIDKSFVQDIGKNGKSSELIRAILSMAREMGMETTAEGVETNEQLVELKQLSCNFGQGYLFSKPVDHLAVVKLLEQIQPMDQTIAPIPSISIS